MRTREEFEEAKSLIFKILSVSYPNKITLDDRDIGFYDRNDIGQERNRRAKILDDAFRHLRQKQFIEYTSPDSRLPRVGLRLTALGLDEASPKKNYAEPWWRSFDRRIAVLGIVIALLALAASKEFL